MRSCVGTFQYNLTSSLLLFFCFGRIATSKGRDSWYHETFIRGCPEKLPQMSRTKRKGKFSKQASTSTHSSELSTQGSTDSLDVHVEEEEDVLQGSECGSSVIVDTVQVSNGTNPAVSFTSDVFDEVEALFPIQDFSQNVERLITSDGGCTKTVDKMMPFRPQVSNSDDHQESNTFKLVNNCGDAMLIEIEPLPIHCFNVLGSDESQTENADLDDFQKFLGRLIK